MQFVRKYIICYQKNQTFIRGKKYLLLSHEMSLSQKSVATTKYVKRITCDR